uniref:Uncharacterized protein n=1 Tax=Rhizophora mucronata TaxID=61149 RepID=A0A2P2P7J2_RHIMU
MTFFFILLSPHLFYFLYCYHHIHCTLGFMMKALHSFP